MIEMRKARRWLLRSGFVQAPGNGSGHSHFRHPNGCKIMLRAHGRNELDPWSMGHFMNGVRRAGFDAKAVRRELEQ